MVRRSPAGPGTDSFERRQESVALLKMLALGNRQIDAGRLQPAGKVVAQLRDGVRTWTGRLPMGRPALQGPSAPLAAGRGTPPRDSVCRPSPRRSR